MKWKNWIRHDSFKGEINGLTYYIYRVGDKYKIVLKYANRGRTRWMSYGRHDTIVEAKQFCEEYEKAKVAA